MVLFYGCVLRQSHGSCTRTFYCMAVTEKYLSSTSERVNVKKNLVELNLNYLADVWTELISL